MAEVIPGQPLDRLVTPVALDQWIEFILAIPVVLWGGWPFFQRGCASVIHRSLNMFTLIAVGVGVAFVYSVAALLIPGRFRRRFGWPADRWPATSSCGRDRHAGSLGTGFGTPRSQPNQRRDQSDPSAGSENSPAGEGRRNGSGRAFGQRPPGESASCPAWRKGAGRRDDSGRFEFGR